MVDHARKSGAGGALRQATVLVVDDEASVREALKSVLHAAGYQVLAAESGDEALRLLEGAAVEVVISDQRMAGMSGVDLLKLVRVRHPRVVRIMLSGDKDPDLPVRSINESEVYRFLRKPWANADLRTVVSLALDVARLQQEKRHLITLLRKQLASPDDPADIEAEILKLAEEEIGEG
jgi:DNA-binding NtrC family response regulator